MRKSHLIDILDSGWTPSIDTRVNDAMEYITQYDKNIVLNTLSETLFDLESQLKLQTDNVSGSGNQQDFIDAYILAYKSCMKLIEKYNKQINQD
ncbi:hypothetical protein H5125_21020 [Shewanella sp. SR44-4]|uniref:hypothetical protein n=1 Tax=Shewanella sp. SR44-4 TaxID=2760935 RepID=UPI001601B82A|nr:hypothetical protein [Shewanella sp. SR44-4]MBB1364628.1 hypothetical protein [Shewanella sp. SR44-4]